MELPTSRLLSFAKKLQRTRTFGDLFWCVHEEVQEATGYSHTWFMVSESEDASELRTIEISGERRELMWDLAPVLQVSGDAFLEELVRSEAPVVIEDARVDPRTNKQLVAQLQNRTLINFPLRLLDKPLGIFGTGTFGDEGCRLPLPHELEYLVGMAGQIAVAAGRIRYIEEQQRAEREKRELERRIMQIQRLESLGMLAGGIAHDFNNLLTVIMSGTALAEARVSDATALGELKAVMAAATRARDLTRQLLAMSRAQALSLRPLDLNGRLYELTDLLRRVFPANVEIALIAGAHLPAVRADASQLDQVFMNLCINARDAMPEGGRLTLETEQVSVEGAFAVSHPWAKPGRYVLTTVTDTGSGMEAELLERVFEPFFTTKAPNSGTGLGLAVAYGIVRQHGGMLQCSSEVGVGTTFKVYLPAFERLAGTAGDTQVRRPRAGRERILVAEDDAVLRALLERILDGAGYQVVSTTDGTSALHLLRTQEFELLLLDVVMPGMQCRDVVDQARALCPQLPILLSSGYSAGANILDLLSGTGLTLLRKPYDPDSLLHVVRDALDRAPSPLDGGM